MMRVVQRESQNKVMKEGGETKEGSKKKSREERVVIEKDESGKWEQELVQEQEWSGKEMERCISTQWEAAWDNLGSTEVGTKATNVILVQASSTGVYHERTGLAKLCVCVCVFI